MFVGWCVLPEDGLEGTGPVPLVLGGWKCLNVVPNILWPIKHFR